MKKYFISITLIIISLMIAQCSFNLKFNTTDNDPKTVDVNLKSANGDTPLHQAASVDRVDAMEILIQRGSDVNSMNKWGHTPLTRAIQFGRINALNVLLNNKANVNLADTHGWTAVFHVSRITLNEEKNVEMRHEMIAKMQMDMLKNLIEHGAKLNIIDNKGRTPLHFYSHYPVIMKYLVDKGLDVNNIDNEGGTPLFAAVSTGNIESLTILLAKGAKVKIMNKKGQTVLDIVKGYNKSKMLELLSKYE
jgi:ankyrin repeat protein